MTKKELLRTLENVNDHQDITIATFDTGLDQVTYHDIAYLEYSLGVVTIRATNYESI